MEWIDAFPAIVSNSPIIVVCKEDGSYDLAYKKKFEDVSGSQIEIYVDKKNNPIMNSKSPIMSYMNITECL